MRHLLWALVMLVGCVQQPLAPADKSESQAVKDARSRLKLEAAPNIEPVPDRWPPQKSPVEPDVPEQIEPEPDQSIPQQTVPEEPIHLNPEFDVRPHLESLPPVEKPKRPAAKVPVRNIVNKPEIWAFLADFYCPGCVRFGIDEASLPEFKFVRKPLPHPDIGAYPTFRWKGSDGLVHQIEGWQGADAFRASYSSTVSDAVRAYTGLVPAANIPRSVLDGLQSGFDKLLGESASVAMEWRGSGPTTLIPLADSLGLIVSNPTKLVIVRTGEKAYRVQFYEPYPKGRLQKVFTFEPSIESIDIRVDGGSIKLGGAYPDVKIVASDKPVASTVAPVQNQPKRAHRRRR